MRDLHLILTKGKTILQNYTPFDTGNMRFNAVKKLRIGVGQGLIRLDGRDAHYAYYVQEGKGVHNPKNKGFVDRARLDIVAMINSHYIKGVKKTYTKLRKPHLEGERLLEREERLMRSRLRYDKDIEIRK